ncbi:MAG: helix-turn-helix transcriptional regulator [Candidatus Dojkabacteria bacterium]|nr:MAG: helix-turn-helix transcriptional regulator [Candidatus Dojkabacteria bacterium]
MKTTLLKKFGERIRAARTKIGMSQEVLAKKSGLHRTYIGMIERAEKNVTLQNMSRILKAMKIKISDFFKDF